MSDLGNALDWIVQATDIELADPQNEERLNIVIKAARDVANGEQTYRCSQHGFRGTPRCNDNPACSLQPGVWVGVTTKDDR